MRKQKVGKVCVYCGEEDIDRLDFHHSDPATKCFTIGTTATRSREAILEEIAKCELLCHACHTITHNQTKERCKGKWVSRSQV